MSEASTEALATLKASARLYADARVGTGPLLVADLLAALEQAERALEQERERVQALYDRAEREPLGANISDYSDEYCAGFLDGQANALDFLLSDHG